MMLLVVSALPAAAQSVPPTTAEPTPPAAAEATPAGSGSEPAGSDPTPAGSTAAGLAGWDGGVDLYRRGVFSTQKTWYWCTAADVQIMRNIVHGKTNHSRTQQRRIFRYMRAHDRYAIPVHDGVDPAGWAAGLRRFVDRRYRLVAKGSFKAALRSAVRNLRRTDLPVGITVAHGNHAWVLTGFTATADPARTDRFKVTSVRVSGPLWGRQNRAFGYDMRPDTKLTRKQLKRFFTAWHYAPVRMSWEGRWVSVQPIARSRPAADAVPGPDADQAAKPTLRERTTMAPSSSTTSVAWPATNPVGRATMPIPGARSSTTATVTPRPRSEAATGRIVLRVE